MALRGIRPSIEELEQVESDPAALESIVDSYLDDEAFAATIRDMHAEIYLLRRDTYNILPAMGALQGYNLQDIYQAQIDEPEKLIEYIVMNDRPYTEIVTADYMLTDDVNAKMYGVPYDFDSGEEWQISAWPDERPRAGLLSSAEIFRRWESDGSNFHRGRANLVAAKMLCEDFDTRDIVVEGGIDIADEFAVAEAAMTEPSCIACHQTLDPLAAYFWGYMQLVHRNAVRDAIIGGCSDWDYSSGIDPLYGPNHVPEYFCYPIKQYSAFMEDEWEFWGLRPPSYFGVEARDLRDVGLLIADDPRFSQCAARQFYGYFAQVAPEEVPYEIAIELQEVLETSGFNAKALAKAAVMHDSFAAYASVVDEQTAADPVVSMKTTRPEQYARMVEDLTGYRWWSLAENPTGCANSSNGTECWGDVDLSISDLFGFRSMQGGIDAINITRPTHTITPTKLITIDILAHDAAKFAIDADWATTPENRRLMPLVEATTSDEPQVREQLAWLHLRILGEFVPVDHEDVTLSYQLWSEVHSARGDTTSAWTVTIAALLQDPRVLFF